MKTKDGVYTGFIIIEEKDILELKYMIKNYKPISENDIAFLHHKLEKKGKIHLVKFFEKHIMGKCVTQNPHKSVSNLKKKTKYTEVEKFQTKICKASDFQINYKEIRVENYVLCTERAFYIPSSILKEIHETFTIRIQPDKTFYFENQGFSRLLKLVENYCFSYLNSMCEYWFKDVIDSIQKNVKRRIYLQTSQFVHNDINGRYELKDKAIQYSPLSKELLRYGFYEFVNEYINIPQIYRDNYKRKFPYSKQIDQFNKKFDTNLTNIIRKYVYYTEKDLEVFKWGGYTPSIHIDFKLTDADTGKGINEWINIDSCLYYQQIELDIDYAPKGSLYDFGDEAESAIEKILESLKEDSAFDLLKACYESIKTKQTVKYESNKYISNNSTTYTYDTKYRYRINNPLLDISDKHYRVGHSKVEDYEYKLLNGLIHKIAYFMDQNMMYSQEWPGGKYVDCYLLTNDEYIVLYALDYSKSTYVFKVKKGYIDIAMFFIWSYFSSSLYNKREGKSIRVERLFSYFGIEWYDNTGSPISKNEDGLYQFILPVCFYRNI